MSNWMKDAAGGVSEDSLSLLARTVQAVDDVNNTIETLEAELKQVADQKKTLEASLADTLSKHGLSELKLNDGRKLTLSEELKVKLPADPVNRAVVLKFIEAFGGADIIKDNLTLLNPSDSLVDALVERGEDFARKSEIHPMTLGAFFREILGMRKGFAPRATMSDVPKEAGLFMYKKISIR